MVHCTQSTVRINGDLLCALPPGGTSPTATSCPGCGSTISLLFSGLSTFVSGVHVVVSVGWQFAMVSALALAVNIHAYGTCCCCVWGVCVCVCVCVCLFSFLFFSAVICPDHASCVFHSIVCFRSFSSSTHASCITLFLPVQEAFPPSEKKISEKGRSDHD